MDITKTPPSLIVTKPVQEAGSRPGKPVSHIPLQLGQIASATIHSRSKEGSFILDLQGQRLDVHSSLNLQVGQKFTFQVNSLQPQIELRLLGDTVKSHITGSLHSLSRRQDLNRQISLLIGNESVSTTLSRMSRQTFTQVQELSSGLTQALTQNIASGSGVPSAQSLLNSISSILAEAAVSTAPDTPKQLSADITPSIRQFLGHILQTMPQAGKHGEADILSQKIRQLLSGQTIPLLSTGKETAAPETMLQQIFNQAAGTQGAVSEQVLQITGMFKDHPSIFPTRQLADLFSILLAPIKNSQSAVTPDTGQDLQQFTEKLGLQFERLLLEGNSKEAAATLKAAVLELEQSAAPDTDKKTASQILQTLETYQLVQGKLSAEALFFLPLPLPFLEQGFLLVDQDADQDSSGSAVEDTKRFALHLKLEGLGNLHIELSYDKEKVDILFAAEDVERTRFLAEHKQELREWLTAVETGTVSFLTGAREPAKVLLSHFTENDTGLVDTQI